MAGIFGDVAPVQNTTLDLAQPYKDAALLAQAGNTLALGQQDLADRDTLRSIATGLTARNPNALGTAASLGQIGQGAVSALSTMDAQTAASKLASLQYSMGLPQWAGAGGAGGAGAPGAGGASAGAAAAAGGTGNGSDPYAIGERLTGTESTGRPGVVNDQGYSGLFQFGRERLADLHMYQPVQGENLKSGAQKWQGTIVIPGFAPMTQQQFLATPDAQRAAMHVHVNDIDGQIAQTPGADRFNRDGLVAVAHLGGIQGMRNFVSSNGQYNPGDAPGKPGGGTHLMDYYNRYSQAGRTQLAADHGHPAGPLPGYDPSAPDPFAGAAVASAAPAQPGAPVAPARPVQVASAAGSPGMPQTMTDAGGGGDNLPIPVPPIPPRGGPPPLPDPAPMAAPLSDERKNALFQQFQATQGAPAASALTAAPGSPAGPSQQAVAQAQREMAGKLDGMTPDAANAAVVARAGQIMQASAPAAAPAAVVPAVAPAVPATTAPNPFSAATPVVPNALAMPAGGAMPPAAQAPTNALAAVPAAAPAGQPAAPPAGQPDMSRLLRDGRGLVVAGPAPGFGYDRVTGAVMQIPGTQKVEIKDAGSTRMIYDQQGNLLRTEAIPDHSRMQTVQGPNGTIIYQSGKPTGDVIPPSTRGEQNAMLLEDYKQVAPMAGQARQLETSLQKTLEARNAAAGLPTGAGFDGRAAAANWLQTYFPSIAKVAVGGDGQLLPDPAKSAEAAKLLMGQAAEQEKAYGGSGGLGLTQMFANNNPNLNMQPSAIRDMSNLAAVTAMAGKDYLQGKIDHITNSAQAFNGPGNNVQYVPAAAFDRAWLTQNNANTYMAAINAMNGKPYDEWSKGLSPADAQRAMSVVARIDPTVTVSGRNGLPLPVSRFAPQNPANPSGAVAR